MSAGTNQNDDLSPSGPGGSAGKFSASALVCPFSPLTIDKNVSRVGASLTGVLLGIYAYTGFVAILGFVLLDYVIRVFVPRVRPPISVVAGLIAGLLRLPKKAVNQGPKIFAWRVGFLFALAATVVYFVDPFASAVIAAVLVGFCLLDGVLNFCVGCVVYTYVTLPIVNARTRKLEAGNN